MIYVLKTSIKTKKEVQQLSHFLSKLLHMEKWNFDLEDCDKILRIDSQTNIKETVIVGLNNRGFECEELE